MTNVSAGAIRRERVRRLVIRLACRDGDAEAIDRARAGAAEPGDAMAMLGVISRLSEMVLRASDRVGELCADLDEAKLHLEVDDSDSAIEVIDLAIRARGRPPRSGR